MIQDSSQDQTVDTVEIANKEDIAHLLTNTSLGHPALSRLSVRLGALKGIESRITGYNRMHHRHNRS